MPTIISRLFRRPSPPPEGGFYYMPNAARSIQHARRLRAGNPWPRRVHRMLTVGLVLAFLAILAGVWSAVLCCTGSDSVRSEGCFAVALWASGAFTLLVLAKCWANSRFPQS